MKMTRKSFFSSATAASVAALVGSRLTAQADEGGAAPEIEGTWKFDDVPAPGGGAVSLQTFVRGGVFLECTVLIAGTSAIPRTTSQGVWERIAPQLYLKTFDYFTQRTSGEVVRVRIREEVRVSGETLTIVRSKLTRYNLDGTLHSETPCSFPNASGSRLPLEAPSCP